jgi:hypothetical protein
LSWIILGIFSIQEPFLPSSRSVIAMPRLPGNGGGVAGDGQRLFPPHVLTGRGNNSLARASRRSLVVVSKVIPEESGSVFFGCCKIAASWLLQAKKLMRTETASKAHGNAAALAEEVRERGVSKQNSILLRSRRCKW